MRSKYVASGAEVKSINYEALLDWATEICPKCGAAINSSFNDYCYTDPARRHIKKPKPGIVLLKE